MSIVTLTTDFGSGSTYVAQMKGVILRIAPKTQLVDITHDLPPQDIRCGAWVLSQLEGVFPSGTIHLAVVDPGVGTDRPILAMRMSDCWWIGPDNGLLSWVALRATPTSIVRLDATDSSSATFHGRDVMAPVAARMASGGTPLDHISATADYVQLPWPAVEVKGPQRRGQIVHIDAFGNVITNFPAESVSEKPIQVRCGNRTVKHLSRTYHEHPVGTLIVLPGSHGFLELAVVDGSAARLLDVAVGDVVEMA